MTIAKLLRDFGPQGLDYTYGPIWKNGENVKGEGDALRFDTTEWGGGGIVLNGANLQPFGETHLAIRARSLTGNAATRLNVNIAREGQKAQTVSFDLSGLSSDKWAILAMPMPDGDFSKVAQVQLQGSDFSAGANALRLEIDRIGTLKLAPGTVAKSQEDGAAAQAIAKDPSGNPASKGKPSEAGWGFYPDYPQAWMAMHNGFLERTKQGREKNDIRVVFLGDSITQGFGGAGKATWEKHYAPHSAVNYGIGGDSTRQVLWRIQNGELDGLNPKLVVL